MTRIWTSFATCIISLGFRQRTHSRPPAAASRWSDEYISRERVGPTFCHSARGPRLLMSQVVALLQFILIIPATKAMYFGEIVQKLLAHDDAAGTDALSDVAGRSQEGDRRSGHASSVDRIHWRELLHLLVAIGLLLCRVLCYLKGSKVSRLCLNEYLFSLFCI